ncbi:MAG: SPFH domain-containing protein, partial [Pseudomonadota bacterium]
MSALPQRGGQRPRGRGATQSSEITNFLSPAMRVAARGWRWAPFLLLLLGLTYALSGLTFVGANQAGIVLRFGAVTRSNGAPIIHPPGLLFALPKPFDTVVKVNVDRVSTITIDDLAPPSWRGRISDGSDDTQEEPTGSLDPERYGYVLTGDRNILHTQIIVRYQIGNPIDYSLLATDRTEFIRTALLASTIRVTGQARLDDLLGGQRDLFSQAVAAD